MEKRVLAILLVLAMAAACMPVIGVGAEPAAEHSHDSSWTKWENGKAMPTAAGKYYLETDVELTTAWVVNNDITICLNGYHIRQTVNGQRVIDINKTLTVYDCTAKYEGDAYVSGTITGGTRTYGAGISVKNNAVLNLYSGAISGNHCTSGDGFGGGIYLVQTKSNTLSGGVFNMYGGEVSGNSAVYGGGVYIPGHNTNSSYTAQPAMVNIYGGKLRGNMATTNGGAICHQYKPTASIYIENAEISGNKVTSTASGKGCGGAVYIEAGGSLTVKDSVIKENISSNGAIYTQGGAPVVLENVQVIDNEANTTGTAGIYVAGASSTLTVTGLVVIDGNENNNIYFNNANAKPLYVDSLASGSKLQYNTNSKVNTDDKVSTVIALASGGKQSSWENISIVCNGEELNYTSTGFKFGHYHGDQKYSAWESGSSLPSNGYNFLTQDVVRTKEAGLAGDSHICLHGHNILVDPNATDTMRMIAVTGKVTIEDCTAHYDADGNYISGKLTGGNRTYGAAVAVRQGGVFTLESGAISGNSNNDEGGAVYINGNSATKNGGKFIMNGGEITGNTTKRGTIAIAVGVASDTTTPGTFIMNGGKIYGNTGDGVYTWANTAVQLLGGSVEERVYTRCNVTLGGNVQVKEIYLMGSTVLDVAAVSGAKVGISAETGNRYISGALTDTTSQFTYLKDDFKLVQQEGKLYLAPTHEHCVEGETGCGHSQLGWSAWTDPARLPESGNYFLETDVELSKTAELKGLNLCLNGHSIKNVADNTRVLNVASGAVTLTDCAQNPGSISGGNRDYGAGITVSNGTTLNLYNITITGNENKADGGALYIRGGGTVNMFSGKITGNTARNGAAVAIADAASGKAGVFNLFGGEISGNTTTGDGTLYGYVGAQFNLLGGSVTGNTAKSGGAVCFGQKMESLTVGGNVQLTGNTTPAGKNDDVYLTAGKIITVGDLSDAKIGVMNDGSAVQITDKEAEGFSSNRSSRIVVKQDGALWLADSGNHKHCLCDGALQGCDHKDISWISWDESDSLPTSGNYYLTCDVTLKATAEIKEDLQLCLNGYTVKTAWQEGDETFRLIGLAAGKTLSVTDCQGTGTLTGGNRDYGSAISVRENAVFNLYSGIISGNTNTIDGTVYIARGTFNMYGGEISGNESGAGGAVCMAESKNGMNSVANLYGGIITGNEAARGGGVYAYDGAIVNQHGTKVDDNKATKYGGGIYLKPNVTYTLTGGSVDNNRAVEFGGGIYMGRGSVELQGGSVSGNRGGKDGGGVYCVAGSITLSGTTVANNASSGAGGGICLVQNIVDGTELRTGSFTMTGGVLSGNESTNSGGGAYLRVAEVKATGGKITGNKAGGNGGGLYLAGSRAVLENVEISQNTAVKESGAVGAGQNQFTLNGEVVSAQAKVTIRDGAKLNNNKAGGNGGAMSVYHETVLTIEGGEIKGNYSPKNGGAIVFGKLGAFKMTGGTIANNTAKDGSGGGLYLSATLSANITGGSITGNRCKKYGAGIYLNKAVVNITGGYIGSNYTEESGSGISSSNQGVVNLYGGTVAGNTSKSSAGGILIQSKSVLNLYGGTVSGNMVSANGGGIFISTNSFLNMQGGTVKNNEAKGGAGIYANGATVKITGGEVLENKAGTGGGGGLYMVRSEAHTEGMTIRGNKAENSGGGLIYSRTTGTVKDCVIENNEATVGGGLLVQMEAKVNVDTPVLCENVTIRGNKATNHSGGGVYIYRHVDVTMKDCLISGNTAVEDGGGVYMNCGSSLNDYRSYLTLENCKVEGNTAGRQGGAAFVNNMMYLDLINTKVLDNKASQEGGGIYGAQGSGVTVTDTLISGNEAGKTGAAVYGGYHVNLLGGTITGNKTAEGAAVYIAPGMYDGHSYTYGKVKMAGNLIIKDNDCPQADLYIDEGRTVGTTAEGFGEDTELHVLLHSGLITTTLIAAYDYEGGDCRYIVTYGDRSMTEIEPGAEGLVAKPLDAQEAVVPVPAKNSNDLILYTGIGVVALLAVAGIVLVLLKKKKTAGAKK